MATNRVGEVVASLNHTQRILDSDTGTELVSDNLFVRYALYLFTNGRATRNATNEQRVGMMS